MHLYEYNTITKYVMLAMFRVECDCAILHACTNHETELSAILASTILTSLHRTCERWHGSARSVGEMVLM